MSSAENSPASSAAAAPRPAPGEPAATVLRPEVAIVGAGPAGSAAALHAAAAGFSVLLIDAATFPRDKTCGDGLTPRALAALRQLPGIDPAEIGGGYRNRGLHLHGFGGSVRCPWPATRLGNAGSAMPRAEFDNWLYSQAAAHPAVQVLSGTPARAPELTPGQPGRLRSFRVGAQEVRPRWVLVADGVKSSFGTALGRKWHRGEVYGIAARAYATTPRAAEPWIHSHVELKDPAGRTQPGYGWIFPLGAAQGRANVGCGALSTAARPAQLNTKKLLAHYVAGQQAEWEFGAPTQVASALLPMGGAVSGVAGANWALLGDAAACVNPLNGEGIDYGLETAQLAVELIASDPAAGLTQLWPELLRDHYGQAFALARTLARALTYPQLLPYAGPVALRGPQAKLIMPAAARLMGNLVLEEDRDLVARLWHQAGRVALRRTKAPLFGPHSGV